MKLPQATRQNDGTGDLRKLDQLRKAISTAERDCTERTAAVEAAETAQNELAQLDADSYLGTISPDEHLRRRADVETRLIAARKDRERAENARTALMERARALAQSMASDARAQVAARKAESDAKIAVLREQLAAEEAANQRLDDDLAIAERAIIVATDEFEADPEVAAQRRHAEQARISHYATTAPEKPDTWPVELADQIRERVEWLRSRHEQRRERTAAYLEKAYIRLPRPGESGTVRVR